MNVHVICESDSLSEFSNTFSMLSANYRVFAASTKEKRMRKLPDRKQLELRACNDVTSSVFGFGSGNIERRCGLDMVEHRYGIELQ